jgi:hypothetical protein
MREKCRNGSSGEVLFSVVEIFIGMTAFQMIVLVADFGWEGGRYSRSTTLLPSPISQDRLLSRATIMTQRWGLQMSTKLDRQYDVYNDKRNVRRRR